MASLLVTGSIGIDDVHTPTTKVERVPGGSATYFAAAASFLAEVRMVGVVGEDWPDDHADLLDRFETIDRRGIERRAGSRTFRWTGRYFDEMNQRETLEVHLGVLGEDPPAIPDEFRDSRFVFLANNHPGNQLQTLEACPERKFAVADTMDLWITTERDMLDKVLENVDGLILNDSEANLLTDRSNAVHSARVIREKHGLHFVIVKKGEHGAVLIHDEGMSVLPAYPLESVVDPTGAGDSFAGGFMGYLAALDRTDYPALQHAMSLGTIVASFTCESFGLEALSSLGMGDLHRRMIDFARMARVV